MNFPASKMVMATAVTGVLVCAMSATALASEINAGYGTVTASALKMRSAPSTSSACMTLLPRSTTVVVEEKASDGWYKVNYKGETGYLSADYVTFSTKGDAKLGNGIVIGSTVNVRAGASTSYDKVGVLHKGDVVVINGIYDGWYKISFSGKTGFIRSDYMDVTTKAPALSSRGPSTSSTAAPSSKGQQVASYAQQFLGVRYVYGGASPKGFDCSGFTMYVAKHFGVNLPHTATSQMLNHGTAVAKSALMPGDYVFFCDPSRSHGKAASHVGIYIGNNQFVHASSGSGRVRVDSLSKAYYAKYYVGAKRIIK